MKINFNTNLNFGMAKLDDDLKTRVVKDYVSAYPAERSAMDYSLKEIAKNCKGGIVFLSHRNSYEDTYSLKIPHSGDRIICEMPKPFRDDMMRVLQKIASNIPRLDETATPFHKASVHIDDIMKDG